MILDTCALLWFVGQRNQLSELALSAIENSTMLGVSAISAFEIGQKYNRGLLELPMPPIHWFNNALEAHQIDAINLSADICLRATELPDIHKDPFDRLIIATAMSKGTPVVTSDSIFEKYGIETIS